MTADPPSARANLVTLCRQGRPKVTKFAAMREIPVGGRVG